MIIKDKMNLVKQGEGNFKMQVAKDMVLKYKDITKRERMQE